MTCRGEPKVRVLQQFHNVIPDLLPSLTTDFRRQKHPGPSEAGALNRHIERTAVLSNSQWTDRESEARPCQPGESLEPPAVAAVLPPAGVSACGYKIWASRDQQSTFSNLQQHIPPIILHQHPRPTPSVSQLGRRAIAISCIRLIRSLNPFGTCPFFLRGHLFLPAWRFPLQVRW